jgi:hypothetical protein
VFLVARSSFFTWATAGIKPLNKRALNRIRFISDVVPFSQDVLSVSHVQEVGRFDQFWGCRWWILQSELGDRMLGARLASTTIHRPRIRRTLLENQHSPRWSDALQKKTAFVFDIYRMTGNSKVIPVDAW